MEPLIAIIIDAGSLDLLAQIEPAPFGWVQFVMQGGAIALLGMIVWQLPKLFRELKIWRTETDVAHREERDALKIERDNNIKLYRADLKIERDQCHENHEKTMVILAQILESQSRIVETLKKLQGTSIQERREG